MANEVIMFNTNDVQVNFTNKELANATKKIFRIGANIRKSAYEIAAVMADVDAKKCYEEDGFKDVHAWAMKTFGFKKSASYTLLKVGKEYTKQLTDAKGKVAGYKSNLTADNAEKDYTTTQIEKMLPVGHDVAEQLSEEGKINPDMSCREIEKVIKTVKNPESAEGSDAEGNDAEGMGEGKREKNATKDREKALTTITTLMKKYNITIEEVSELLK